MSNQWTFQPLLERPEASLFQVEESKLLILEFHSKSSDNRLAPSNVSDLLACLQAAEDRIQQTTQLSPSSSAHSHPSSWPVRGLLLHGGQRKHFSNGFDLQGLAAAATSASPSNGSSGSPSNQSPHEVFVRQFAQILARLVAFPCPTVACLNGHAYGGGLVFASACDAMVMNADRGWLCLPAVSLGIVLPRGLLGVLAKRLRSSPKLLSEVIFQGKQFAAKEALREGIVDQVAPLAELLEAGSRLCPEVPIMQVEALRLTKQAVHYELLRLLQDPNMTTPGLSSKL